MDPNFPSTLRGICLKIDANGCDCSRFKMLESELELSLKRSLQIKEDKMAALEARLQESFILNQQIRQELKSVGHFIRFSF